MFSPSHDTPTETRAERHPSRPNVLFKPVKNQIVGSFPGPLSDVYLVSLFLDLDC